MQVVAVAIVRLSLVPAVSLLTRPPEEQVLAVAFATGDAPAAAAERAA